MKKGYASNIPECIFEFLIYMYQFNKDIKKKIQNKYQSSEKCCILNAELLNHIKMVYNYEGICKELEKYNYKSEYEFESKIPEIIESIIKKGIIKEKVPLYNIKIVPNIKVFFRENHFINFGIINDKILEATRKIKKQFGLTQKLNQISIELYFNPQLFYKGDHFIKIGALNADGVFEIHYFITVDLYSSSLYSLLYDLKTSKTMEEFFKKKNIIIDSKEKHELTHYNQKQGQLINFIFNNSKPKSTTNGNIIYDKPKINTSINKSKNNFPSLPKNDKLSSITQISKNSTDISYKEDYSYLNNPKIKSMKEIKYTPMIGLKNIGQTCYMNAALQCFSNTKALTSYFLNYNKLNFIINNTIIINEFEEPSLAIEYLKLIRHLWCDPPKSFYAPLEFKEKIGKIDPLFKNFEANDAKDFVNFMVMRMHEELNGVDNSLLKQANLVEPPMPINPYNQQQVLQSYLYEFQINFNSFISNCFYGTTQGEFECQNCKMRLYQSGQNMPLIKYNYQTFFFLNFPLDEVRKFILSNQMLYTKYMNSRVNPNDAVDLIDCFYYHQKDELLDCYCERCQSSNAKVISRTRLFVAPSYLIIILNRGKGRQFNIKINFPEEFDTNGIFINPSGIFQLYAVVKHFGESGSSGHFTAYCRSPIDNCWYFYNDDMVSPVGPQDMYQIRDIGLTYMLFYQKKK